MSRTISRASPSAISSGVKLGGEHDDAAFALGGGPTFLGREADFDFFVVEFDRLAVESEVDLAVVADVQPAAWRASLARATA